MEDSAAAVAAVLAHPMVVALVVVFVTHALSSIGILFKMMSGLELQKRDTEQHREEVDQKLEAMERHHAQLMEVVNGRLTRMESHLLGEARRGA